MMRISGILSTLLRQASWKKKKRKKEDKKEKKELHESAKVPCVVYPQKWIP